MYFVSFVRQLFIFPKANDREEKSNWYGCSVEGERESGRHKCTQTKIPMNWPANASVVQTTQNDSYLATIIQLTYSHTFLFIVHFRQGSSLTLCFMAFVGKTFILETHMKYSLTSRKHTHTHFGILPQVQSVLCAYQQHTHTRTPTPIKQYKASARFR